MKLPSIDSLFGRLAFLVIGVLLVSHFAWFLLIRLERDQTQTRYATEETVFLLDAVEQHLIYTPHQPLPSRVSLVPIDSPEVPSATPDAGTDGQRPVVERYLADLRERLPAGTDVRASGRPPQPPRLWVLRPGEQRWVVVPLQVLPPPRHGDRLVIWLALIFSTGVLSALFAAWRLQRPLQ